MKKQIIAYLLLLVISAQLVAHLGYTEVQANRSQKIPKEAIRLRILANSDSEEDQALKRKVRDKVKEQIDTWVADLHSFEEARRVIQSRLPELEQTVARTLKEEGSKQSFTVKFGKHIKFPTKIYGNFIYPAGEYEAVLVTLGKGEGANWWCVLFPPLCFLDFSSSTVIQKEDGVAKAQTIETAATPSEETKEVSVQAPMETETPRSNDVEKQSAEKQVQETAVEERQPVAEVKQIEKKAEPVVENVQQPAKIEVQEVKDEEEVKVKFFFVELFSSLFSK